MQLAHVLSCRSDSLGQRALSCVLLMTRSSCAWDMRITKNIGLDKLLVVLRLTLRWQSIRCAFKIPGVLLRLYMPLVVVKSRRMRHLVRIRVL